MMNYKLFFGNLFMSLGEVGILLVGIKFLLDGHDFLVWLPIGVFIVLVYLRAKQEDSLNKESESKSKMYHKEAKA